MDAFICFSHKIIGSNRKQKHLTFKTYEFIYSLCIHEIFLWHIIINIIIFLLSLTITKISSKSSTKTNFKTYHYNKRILTI